MTYGHSGRGSEWPSGPCACGALPALDEAERHTKELEARLAAVVAALRNAGEWVAAVDPKLPMPGTGDSQEYVLAVIDAALRAAEGRQ